jgi:hypothetical protein
VDDKIDIRSLPPRHLVHVVNADKNLKQIRFLPNFFEIINELYVCTPTQMNQLRHEIEFERAYLD